MTFDDPIDKPTEATMHATAISDTATPRYGYAPQVMFAATRASAERRARETEAAAEATASSPAQGVFRRLAIRLAGSAS